jgi:PhnB protein
MRAEMSGSPIETTIQPWLTVSDGPQAVDFYTRALGAVELYRLDDDEGRAVVAQLEVDGAAFWVQEGPAGPPSREGAVRLILTVNDPDALFERALAAGAAQVAPVADAHGWRTGRVADPFGHDWELSKPL